MSLSLSRSACTPISPNATTWVSPRRLGSFASTRTSGCACVSPPVTFSTVSVGRNRRPLRVNSGLAPGSLTLVNRALSAASLLASAALARLACSAVGASTTAKIVP